MMEPGGCLFWQIFLWLLVMGWVAKWTNESPLVAGWFLGIWDLENQGASRVIKFKALPSQKIMLYKPIHKLVNIHVKTRKVPPIPTLLPLENCSRISVS